jgi:hypothetical protein
MNADCLQSPFFEGEDLFDLEDDLQTMLISAAGYGLKVFELEDGVEYDEMTGLALDCDGLLTEG